MNVLSLVNESTSSSQRAPNSNKSTVTETTSANLPFSQFISFEMFFCWDEWSPLETLDTWSPHLSALASMKFEWGETNATRGEFLTRIVLHLRLHAGSRMFGKLTQAYTSLAPYGTAQMVKNVWQTCTSLHIGQDRLWQKSKRTGGQAHSYSGTWICKLCIAQHARWILGTSAWKFIESFGQRRNRVTA